MYDSNFCHEIYIINYSNKIIKRIHDNSDNFQRLRSIIMGTTKDSSAPLDSKCHENVYVYKYIYIHIHTHKKTTTDFSNEQIERTVISGYKRNAGRIKRIFISRCHGRRFRRRYFIVISLLYPAHG